MNRERNAQIQSLWERFLEGMIDGWANTLGQVVGKAMYWSLIVGLGVFLAQETGRIKESCDACPGDVGMNHNDSVETGLFEGRSK